jgi:hypothetical protein
MTLIEVIDAARFLLNEDLDAARSYPDDTSSFFKDSTLQRFFNIIQEEVQNEIIDTYEDYFLTQTFLAITAGCAGYQMPSGTIKVRRVEDVRGSGDPVEIKPVTINDKGYGFYELTSSVWKGGNYYLAGNELVLTSTPSFSNASAIRLHYIKRLPDVTAATGISEIPPNHHGTLVYGIYKMGLIQQQAPTDKAELEYEKRLNRLKKHAESRQVQRPRRVKSHYFDED